MGFDLWSAVGVSPMTALAVAAGGLALAGLMALRIFWRDRAGAATGRGLGLQDGPREDRRPYH